MISRTSFCLSWVVAAVILLPTTDARAQGRRSGGPGGPATQAVVPPTDPLTGPVVTNAPYSGDAVTTITQTLGDGTRIEERTEARFYRDSAGRVRREQTILGLAALNPAAQPQTLITIDPTPDAPFAYTLDPAARTARRVPRAAGRGLTVNLNGAVYAASAEMQFRARTVLEQLNSLNGVNLVRGVARGQAGTPPNQESLGTRQFEGIRATGSKTTSTIPTGQIGNDRPIVITDERWESPELKVLVYSRFSDPRTGVVEYKLTNISRNEPPSDLFTVPADYTLIEPGGGVGGRGRVAGPGGRGPQ